MKQTFILLTLIASIFSFNAVTAATPNHSSSARVPVVSDMAKIGQIARNKNIPIILVFTAEDCPYCVLLEKEILKPMIFSGDYTKLTLIYKINIDDEQDILDFNGEEISTSDFAYKYNAQLTPTMLFLDSKGNELHQRILGINTVELFGGRVDDAIDISLAKLNNKTIARNQIRINP
ncbi:MAG: thioredoxin fold domain-containing protein [Gammaproteobacteria bacterium]|nr:thioredoxin fold domain-containing protein [Gammaproteobacteria bacterium]